MKRQRSHRWRRDRSAAYRRWWRQASTDGIAGLVALATRETLQQICAFCCADLRHVPAQAKWLHTFVVAGRVGRAVSCSAEMCRTQTAIGLQRLQSELLRREAWAWNAPLRAAADLLLDTSGDIVPTPPNPAPTH